MMPWANTRSPHAPPRGPAPSSASRTNCPAHPPRRNNVVNQKVRAASSKTWATVGFAERTRSARGVAAPALRLVLMDIQMPRWTATKRRRKSASRFPPGRTAAHHRPDRKRDGRRPREIWNRMDDYLSKAASRRRHGTKNSARSCGERRPRPDRRSGPGFISPPTPSNAVIADTTSR